MDIEIVRKALIYNYSIISLLTLQTVGITIFYNTSIQCES